MAMDLEKRLKLIDEKVSSMLHLLKNQEPKKTWLSASVVFDLTGWDANYLRKVRKYTIAEYRKKGKYYEYCLESINPAFIRKLQEN